MLMINLIDTFKHTHTKCRNKEMLGRGGRMLEILSLRWLNRREEDDQFSIFLTIINLCDHIAPMETVIGDWRCSGFTCLSVLTTTNLDERCRRSDEPMLLVYGNHITIVAAIF